VNDFSPVALQRFDHLFAFQQGGNLFLELFDLGDFLVDLDDLAFKIFVPRLLIGKRAFQIGVSAEPDRGADGHDHTQHDKKMLLLLRAPHLAMRQQIDAGGHLSNLLIARPQATISEGASCSRFLRRM